MAWRVGSMRKSGTSLFFTIRSSQVKAFDAFIRPSESAVAEASPKRGNAEGISLRDTVLGQEEFIFPSCHFLRVPTGRQME
jgi:hypothetical protein